MADDLRRDIDTLFFFGSLRDTDLLAVVLGRRVSSDRVRPASLPGYAVHRVADERFPMLVRRRDSRAPGLLLTHLTPDELSRVDFYEDVDYELTPTEVETRNGTVRTHAYMALETLTDSGEPWDIDRWRREDKRIMLACAEEMMRYHGILTHEEIDARWPAIKARVEARLAAEETGRATVTS